MNGHPSLPFGGGTLYVSAFWATFALWQAAELVLAALFGIALALRNRAGLLAMLAWPGSAVGYGTAVEEAALLKALGELYARYLRRTWRLSPYLL